MTDPQTPTPETPEQPPYVIEGARSSRSKCKTCRRAIVKDTLRLGVLVDGRFGVGYMWHHLKCMARTQFERVEEAYAIRAWEHAKQPPAAVPELETLRKLQEAAEEKRQKRKTIPYAEISPSGRAKCKHCDGPIDKGSPRVVLGREVEFGSQVRVGPINVHPRCVAAELMAADCATETEGFGQALGANSEGMDAAAIDEILREIDLP